MYIYRLGGRGFMRIDKYLKVARIIKRRTIAGEACDAGRVFINGQTAKAGSRVKEGDIIEIHFGNQISKVEVLQIKEHVKKEEAEQMYRYVD